MSIAFSSFYCVFDVFVFSTPYMPYITITRARIEQIRNIVVTLLADNFAFVFHVHHKYKC
jgi:hypothetical protein